MNIVYQCPSCKKMKDINVNATTEQYMNWKRGELIQNAMPQASATEREVLMTGFCPPCQDKIFGCDDEEEYAC